MKLWQAVTFDTRDIYAKCGVCGFQRWLSRLQFGAPVQPACPRCKLRKIPQAPDKLRAGNTKQDLDLDLGLEGGAEQQPHPAPKQAPKAPIKEGDRFGDWTVMEVRKGDLRCLCRCKCGSEVQVLRAMLHVGESKSCRACARVRHKGTMSEHWEQKRNG